MKGHLNELREILTYFRFSLQQREKGEEREFYDRVNSDVPPILLIHGFLGTRSVLLPLEMRLKRDGFVVFSINLGALNIGDIRKSALRIHHEIQEILREVDLDKIDIIGHSMGGLIGLYYIKKLSGHRFVRKLITLGTPHGGTWVALAGIATLGLLSPSTWQLIPEGFFLRELRADNLPEEVDFYSIAGEYDVVVPPERSLLEGSKSFKLPCGHAGLATSTIVYRTIRDILLDNYEKEYDSLD